MTFEFKEYYFRTFTYPLILASVLTAFLIILIILLFKLPSEKKKFTLKNTIGLMVIFLLIIASGLPLKYGVLLINENDNNVVTLIGEIQYVKDIFGESPRYYYNGKVVFASIVTIDNKELYFMTKGDLEIGDNIRVEYLPKSLFVLKVEILNNN